MLLDQGTNHCSATGRPRAISKEAEGFLFSREVEGCSPQTLIAYRRVLRPFTESLAGKPLCQVQRLDVELYLATMRSRGCSPFYIDQHWRCLSTFFHWCKDEQFVVSSPMQNMKKPRLPRRTKPFLQEDQLDRLLAVCSPGNFCGARSRAMLLLLWTTGMRVGELGGLKLSDLDWEKGRIKVFGKGSKERFVPFLPEAKKAVWRYLSYREDSLPDLWLGEERRPLRKWGVSSMTRRLMERAGLVGQVKDLHHIFRRSWAARNLRQGIPVKFVQLIGGWSNLSTLDGYVRAMQSDEALGAKWS